MSIKEAMPTHEILAELQGCTIYEDDTLLIIDKPFGIAVHGGSGLRGGVIEALRNEASHGSYLELVHRLDRDTSGCLMLAKDPTTLRFLHKSLQDSTSNGIRKKYLSLLVGNWTNGPRNIDLNLETVRTKNRSSRSVVTSRGRHASSKFFPIRQFDGYVLVEIKLKTGRMHQIRAHAAAIGYPVGGDRKYGRDEDNRNLRHIGLNRLFLHAAELELRHPRTNKKLVVNAAIPGELARVLEELP
jgi:23S rRNA pseudouridine955/2504/2580 synthase